MIEPLLRRVSNGTGWTAPGFALLAVLCSHFAAQAATIAIEPPKPHPLGFLTRPYQQRTVPPIDFENSSRLHSLIRAGNLYLTAQDAVALALENNIDIQIQRYGPLLAREVIRRAQAGGALRDISVSIFPGSQSVSLAGVSAGAASVSSGAGVGSGGGIVAQIGSAVPLLDPMLNFSASTGHYTYPLSNLILDQTNYLVYSSRNFSVGYSQQFLSGTNLSFSFNTSRFTDNSPTELLNPYTYGTASLGVTQNLLQGFGLPVNNRYIRIAKNNAKVTDLQLKQQVITTVSAVLNLYWDLVAFTEGARLKEQALEAARRLYEDNRKKVAAGAIAGIDVTRAQAEVPSREQDVLIAQTNVLQQEIVLKDALLTHAMGDPLIEGLHIIPLDHIAAPDKEELPPVKTLLQEALSQRSDVQQTRINIESSVISLAGSKSALRPQLQAFAALANHAQAGTPNPLNIANEYGTPDPFYLGGYGSLLGQLLRRNFPDYSVGFSLSIPIRNRAAQADYVMDQLQLRQSQLQLERGLNRVAVEVRNAVIGVQQAHARYETAISARALAEETRKAEERKYEFGTSTNVLVIQAQRDVVAAESEEVQAMANYTHARIAFDQAIGTTLERNNITMEEAAAGRVERQSWLRETPLEKR